MSTISKQIKVYISKRNISGDRKRHWISFSKYFEKLIIIEQSTQRDLWFRVYKNSDANDSSSEDSESPDTFYHIETDLLNKVHNYIAAGIAMRIERSFRKEKRWRWTKERIANWFNVPLGKALLYSKFVRDWDNIYVFGSRAVITTEYKD